jgi:hypothetical protein
MLGVLASVGAAGGDRGKGKGWGKSVEAKLSGYEEVPAISTTGRGKIKLKIRNGSTAPTIEYKLSYSGLSSAASAAHIHFGQEAVNGAVSAFLCGGPPPNPACGPGNNGNKVTITGSIAAAQVIGPAAQGIAPGEIAELLAAIKAGVAYANVHTATYPGGEIRGQLDRKHDDD